MSALLATTVMENARSQCPDDEDETKKKEEEEEERRGEENIVSPF